MIGAIDAYNAALAIIPDRADALEPRRRACVRLGQLDDAIKQYELAPSRIRRARPSGSTWARLLQVRTARRRSTPEASGIRGSPGEERLPAPRRLLQTGQAKDAAALLRPREQMFGDDLSFAYLLGSALDADERNRRRSE